MKISAKAINEVKAIIARLEDNICRLKSTIDNKFYQKGYVENCKACILSYENQISQLKTAYSL